MIRAIGLLTTLSLFCACPVEESPGQDTTAPQVDKGPTTDEGPTADGNPNMKERFPVTFENKASKEGVFTIKHKYGYFYDDKATATQGNALIVAAQTSHTAYLSRVSLGDDLSFNAYCPLPKHTTISCTKTVISLTFGAKVTFDIKPNNDCTIECTGF